MKEWIFFQIDYIFGWMDGWTCVFINFCKEFLHNFLLVSEISKELQWISGLIDIFRMDGYFQIDGYFRIDKLMERWIFLDRWMDIFQMDVWKAIHPFFHVFFTECLPSFVGL